MTTTIPGSLASSLQPQSTTADHDARLRTFRVQSVGRGLGGLLNVVSTDRRKAIAFWIDGEILLSQLDNQPIASNDRTQVHRIEGEIRAVLGV